MHFFHLFIHLFIFTYVMFGPPHIVQSRSQSLLHISLLDSLSLGNRVPLTISNSSHIQSGLPGNGCTALPSSFGIAHSLGGSSARGEGLNTAGDCLEKSQNTTANTTTLPPTQKKTEMKKQKTLNQSQSDLWLCDP